MLSKFLVAAVTILVILFQVFSFAHAVASLNTAATSSATHKQLFETFKAKHGKTYVNAEEEATRFAAFEHNLGVAAAHQARNPKAVFGDSPYMDLTPSEFKVYHNAERYYANWGAKYAGEHVETVSPAQLAAAASSVDWRKHGAVTYVKNQGQCGSCWSFSTTGGIEGQWKLAGHTLVAVSEQEFVSCDTTDSGCQGGLMDNAFKWAIDNWSGWVTGESDYPYVSGGGNVPSCQYSGKPKVAQITGYHNLEHNEDAMAAWCSTGGPVSIGVDASAWQTYQGGIMTNCPKVQVDHGVLIVGFDNNHSPAYWIIKNSWGPGWGEEGYIRVEKGSNQCLITSAPSHPVAGSGPAPPPGPPGPAPPTPPTPPTPSGGTFTQSVCPQGDFMCLGSCSKHTFNQGSCLRMQGGGSAIGECTSTELILDTFQSDDCSGSSQKERQPLDKCLEDESGSYIYNSCSNSQQQKSAKKVVDTVAVNRMKSQKL